MTATWCGSLMALALVLGAVGPAGAQIFLASRPHPEFRLGPLQVRASVPRHLGAATVDVQWSLEIPPTVSALDVEQDLYLLWPGAVSGGLRAAKPDPALRQYVEARGFVALDEGRLPLVAQALYQAGARAEEPVPGGAPFVTYVRTGGAGLTPPATWIRIPWSWKLANRAFLLDLRMRTDTLVQPRKATWLENVFRGPRHIFSITYNDVRPPAVFPMYFEHRDRVIRLADAPTELVASFPDADHLKIDEVYPQSSSKRLSETLESTEIVSFFLEKSEGVAPQQLTVQFGYFSGLQAWLPVLIPVVFFILGKVSGPVLARWARRAARNIMARVQVGRPSEGPRPRETGVFLGRDVLEKIVPGVTTYDDVLRLCGPAVEQHEDLTTPEHRVLIYNGRRLIPQRHRRFGWLATVSQWGVEHQTVQIDVEADRVSDLQARIRRTNMAARVNTGPAPVGRPGVAPSAPGGRGRR